MKIIYGQRRRWIDRFGCFDFLSEIKSKSRAESEERERVFRILEEMGMCEYSPWTMEE